MYMLRPISKFCEGLRQQTVRWDVLCCLKVYVDDVILTLPGERYGVSYCYYWASRALLLQWLLDMLRKPLAAKQTATCCIGGCIEIGECTKHAIHGYLGQPGR